MNYIAGFKRFCLPILLLIIGSGIIFFVLPKPPLLEGLSFSTAVYDKQQHLLRLTLTQDSQFRLFTPLAQMAPELIEATLLQEDQYFWRHVGVNPLSVLRAFWQTYVIHSRSMGASTITMQVARLRYGLQTKSWSGKGLQMLRAIELERHYTKKQILEAYLNLAPYGGNIQGVGAASLIYFNQPAKQLQLPEALTLSVIPQNPLKRTPDNQQLLDIRNKLFSRWLQVYPEAALQQPKMHLPIVMRMPKTLPFIAPHFVNHVLQALPIKTQSVRTTLDGRLQTILERITRQYVHQKAGLGVENAAVLVVDARDMSIQAAVGSVDFFNQRIQGQIPGTDIKRSPGSTLKPFIYGLALDQGLIHPATVLKDVPHRFGQYNPENFDYDFMGPVKARDALILSRNIPAIDLANQLTHPNLYELLETAEVSHLKSESFYGLALALGGGEVTMRELVGLYAMLVNDGMWHPLRQNTDETIAKGKRMLSPEASFLVLDMLKDTPCSDANMTRYPLAVSWKTGTSSGYRDAWTVGSFGPYVLAVWLGNFNNQSNPALIGKKLAAPLFFALIDAMVHEFGSLPTLTQDPKNLNLRRVDVCKASGMLPTRFCPDKEATWFIPGKSPIKTDTIYREVAIDGQTGLRTCHIDSQTQFRVYEFWSTDLLRIFKQAGIQRRSPPPFVEGCFPPRHVGTSPVIISPQSKVRYVVGLGNRSNNQIPLTATVDADVRTLYWFLNGQFLGKTRPDEALMWPLLVGRYIVRVVDDHGLSDTQDMVVQSEG
jgi:penicillin-binding protein 1C